MIEKYLESVLNQCLDILESDSGSILLLDKNSREIVVRVARGRNKQSIIGRRVKLGEGISGMVALKRQPMLVADVRNDDAVGPHCRRNGNYRTNSFLSVPLACDGKLLGVINVTEKNNAVPFTIKELSFVGAIASSAARTLEKMTHVEHLERQLECFRNSTAVSRLTASIAHELNNPLDGILRYTNLCMQTAAGAADPVLKEYLLEIRTGLKRMAETLRSMLEFSFAGDRKHNPVIRPEVDINEVIRKTIASYNQQVLCKNITVETELSAGIPEVKDWGLEHLCSNLIKNAFEAVPERGKLVIRSCRSNGAVLVSFTDNGAGIEAEPADKIFEPFFTTKPKGKGLGLAIVKEIVNCYDGTIKAENVPQGGAKFTVEIPVGGANENTYTGN